MFFGNEITFKTGRDPKNLSSYSNMQMRFCNIAEKRGLGHYFLLIQLCLTHDSLFFSN